MPNSQRLTHRYRLLAALCASTLLTLMPALSQTATNIGFLGTSSSPFEVDTESGFTTAGFTQGATTLTLTMPFANGQTLFGAFGSLNVPLSLDWSSYEDIAFSLSATVPTSASLGIDFYASDLATVLAKATLPNGGMAPSATNSIVLQFTEGTIADLTNVGGLFMTWAGDYSAGPPADSAITIHSIQAVPEPSTWALLSATALVFGLVVWRRRTAVARR